MTYKEWSEDKCEWCRQNRPFLRGDDQSSHEVFDLTGKNQNQIINYRTEHCDAGTRDDFEAELQTKLEASERALASAKLETERLADLKLQSLCPPHQKVATILSEFPQQYGCPQCSVNHIAELEELIYEMWGHLPGRAKLRFNDSEAGRIVDRANIDPLVEAIKAIDTARQSAKPEAQG